MTGDRLYSRTQVAWPTIAPLAVVAAVLVPIFRTSGLVAPLWIVGAIYGAILLLFATLTVSVTSDGLTASFGIGLVRKSVPFADVTAFARVRNRWIDGWGIHTYPGGVLYNASGLSAVEFTLASGGRVSIGTAEPDALVAAIEQAAGKRESAHEPRTGRVWGAQHTAAVVIAVIALAFAGVTVYVTLQPPTVIAGGDSLYVSNGLYRNTIPYSSMESVTLEDRLPRIGLKVNGSGVGNTMRGNYRVDGWGTARLYINHDVPPFVVIRSSGSRVVVNFPDASRTRALFEDLRTHMSQRRG